MHPKPKFWQLFGAPPVGGKKSHFRPMKEYLASYDPHQTTPPKLSRNNSELNQNDNENNSNRRIPRPGLFLHKMYANCCILGGQISLLQERVESASCFEARLVSILRSVRNGNICSVPARIKASDTTRVTIQTGESPHAKSYGVSRVPEILRSHRSWLLNLSSEVDHKGIRRDVNL